MAKREGKKADFDSGRDGNWRDKCKLLDAIDSMRSGVKAAPPIFPDGGDGRAGDAAALREKLEMYEKTCFLLEKEVEDLEQQALAALAEAGRLRAELDRSEEQNRRRDDHMAHRERDDLRRILAEGDEERRLLVSALENSEAELARMTKTIDLLARRLQAV